MITNMNFIGDRSPKERISKKGALLPAIPTTAAHFC